MSKEYGFPIDSNEVENVKKTVQLINDAIEAGWVAKKFEYTTERNFDEVVVELE